MKIIRSSLLPALSIMLLLSNMSVRTMELGDNELAQAQALSTGINEALASNTLYASEIPVVATPVAQTWASSAKGLLSSASGKVGSLYESAKNAGQSFGQSAQAFGKSAIQSGSQKAQNVWAHVPSIEQVKQTATNAAGTVKETVQAHPYITAGAIAGTAAVAGLGIYGYKKMQSRKATNALLEIIFNELSSDLKKALASINSKEGKVPGSLGLAKNLQPLVAHLPMSDLKDALNNLTNALIAFDRSSNDASLEDLNNASKQVQALRRNLKSPTISYLPSNKTAAIAATAAIAGLVAYESGLVDKAIDAAKGIDYAGLANKAHAVVAPIRNINYSAIADKANKAFVAPILNADYVGMAHTTGQFVADNKVPFGVTGLIAGGHLIGHEYKKAVKYTKREKALVNVLNAVDSSKVQ